MVERADATLLKTMSCNIRKLRKKYSAAIGRTVSQRECAEKIGAVQQMWATWESGKKLPSAKNQKKIADLFKVAVDALWEGEAHRFGRDAIGDLAAMDAVALTDLKRELLEQIAMINRVLAEMGHDAGDHAADSSGSDQVFGIYQVPVLGLAACNVIGWYKPKPLALKAPLPIPYADPQHLFAVIAVGTSMLPEGIKEGFLLYCDPTIVPESGDSICVSATDGTVTVKKFLSRDDEFLHMQGWNDPDKNGVQKVMNIDYATEYVESVATVVFVRRKA